MKDLVSIVVPIYNVEKYLDRCVQSLTAQTYPHLDIVLVDDGSTDGSAAICDAWARKDSRIQVVHKENAGPGIARNTGIAKARGRYILFCDSDDYVDSTLVETCVENAQRHGAEVVMFGRTDVYDDTKFIQREVKTDRTVFCEEAVTEELLPQLFTYELGFGVSAWSKMFELDIIRKHDLKFMSRQETLAEDAHFMLEVMSHTSTAVIVPKSLYFYCRRSGSYSRGYRMDRQKRNDEFLLQCVEYVEKSKLPAKVIPHLQSRYHGLTLGTLMQIVRSDLSQKEKRRALYGIYRNEILQQTMGDEVVALDGKFPQIFWRCLRNRLYGVCTLLLYVNMWK